MWLCKLEIPFVSARALRSCSDWLVGTELVIGLDVAVELRLLSAVGLVMSCATGLFRLVLL